MRPLVVFTLLGLLLLAGCISNPSITIEQEAMHLALQDEYHAEEMYEVVMKQFGEVRPFSNIIYAEQHHSNRIEKLLQSLDYPIPDRKMGDTLAFISIKEACSHAVHAEKENIALYNTLLPMLTSKEIRETFIDLRDASELRHLPAFERCGGR